ncbi:MAG: hypothetical protein V2I97_09275, partial [Desulfococcaceae bacterium]|nr:hypothetical protein [Desulfococcaceae bacterium]
MIHSNLTELLHQADRKIVQEAVEHLQKNFAFRNAELLRLKTEKEKSEQQYQNLAGVHQELLKEYQASTDTFNKKLSEFKKEMQKKDE